MPALLEDFDSAENIEKLEAQKQILNNMAGATSLAQVDILSQLEEIKETVHDSMNAMAEDLNNIDQISSTLSPVTKSLTEKPVVLSQTDVSSLSCGQCIREQSRYCFLQIIKDGSTVTNGQGKCCGKNDFKS